MAAAIDWATLEAENARLNAFVDFDRAATGGDGPLAGVGIGIKSSIAVRGLPWTAGMALRRDIVAGRDAAVVAALRAAGAVILGTLNMDEAALGAATDNRWFGRTTNPHRDGYTPGGSSGGSGAAVAAGLCDAALGSDTLGSVRIPASYTGVYGLKPGEDAVDADGLVPMFPALDAIGPLARSLDMLGRVWSAIGREGGHGAGVAFGRSVVLADLGGTVVEPAVRDGYDRALAAAALPVAKLVLADSLTAIRRAALAGVGRAMIADLGADRDRTDLLSDELTSVLAALERMAEAPDVLVRTRGALRAALGDDGVLLMPATPQTAFRHGTRAPTNQADFTCLANVAGLPALALPAARDADGLPVGIQLVGPPHSETRLIALGRRLDAALDGYFPPAGFLNAR